MPVPLIGVTASRVFTEAGFPAMRILEAYVQAVSQAGAAPVLIPLGLTDEALRVIAARLDGIVFTGGGDILPQVYGADDHPAVDGVDADRDRVEIDLVKEVARSKLPFLGICRGIQVINVALGGTLYADIPDQFSGALKHDFSSDTEREVLAHAVEVDKNSRLAGILGITHTGVNSLHHQGLLQLAPGLKPVAYAPDGLVEAIELEGHPFGLAVQWHPEWMQKYAPMRALFKAFVTAAHRNA
jgi:putative glutamine amidotransferase